MHTPRIIENIVTEMKNSNLLAGAAVMCAVTLAGCSVFGGKSTTPVQPEKPISQSIVTPTVNSNLAKSIAGEWVITDVNGQNIVRDDDMPYLNFVPAESRFYGSNGCNILNGSYAINGNNLTFSGVMATMRACPDMDLEQKINAVIADGTSVTVNLEKRGNESYMTFADASGKTVMQLVRHSMQFLNGNWQVTAINGKAIEDEEANIFFDIAEMKVHGNTGCNFFNGQILIDPAVPNSLSLGGMGVTRRACYKGDQERTMLVALEETVSAARDGAEHAVLLDAAGNAVINLKRAPVEE